MLFVRLFIHFILLIRKNYNVNKNQKSMHLQVGRGGCKKGVCTEFVNSEDMTVEFPHLGIQCVRKKDVDQSLKVRKEIRVDPYRAEESD